MASFQVAAALLAEAWQQTPDQGPEGLRAFALAALTLGAEIGCAEMTDREADWLLYGRPSVLGGGVRF
jgi:hypothetical protein